MKWNWTRILAVLLTICMLWSSVVFAEEGAQDGTLPVETPAPTAEAEPTEIPAPTVEAEPTEVPAPTAEAEPTETPAPTEEAEATEEPAPTAEVEATEEPAPTVEVEATEEPAPTVEVEATEEPVPTVDSEIVVDNEMVQAENAIEMVQEKAACMHENYDYVYNDVCEYIDITEKTHRSIWKRIYSYTCLDCGYEWQEIESEEEREGRHYFRNGACEDCGYVNTCKHEHVYNDKGYDYDNEEYLNLTEKSHTYRAPVITYYVCADCGEEWADSGEVEEVQELHSFYDGKCRCGFEKAACVHENAKRTNVYMTSEQYTNPTADAHTKTGICRVCYECPDCGKDWFEDAAELTQIQEVHSFNYNNECMDCGYVKSSCAHKHVIDYISSTGEDTYLKPTADGHTWKGWSVLKHSCLDCGEWWQDEPYPAEELQPHDFYDGVCENCGYKNICAHKNVYTREVLDDYWGFTDITAEGHTAVVRVYYTNKCLDCGEFWVKGFNEYKTVSEPHDFRWSDTCDCGYKNPCKHGNVEVYTSYGDSAYTSLAEKGHKVNGYARKNYTCLDCGAEWESEPDLVRTETVWSHDFDEDGKCYDCGYVNECKHENAEEYSRYEYAVYSNLTAEGHTVRGFLNTWKYCLDCDQLFDDVYASKSSTAREAHYFEDGVCEDCGYAQATAATVTSAVCSHQSITAMNTMTFTVKTSVGANYLKMYSENGGLVKTWTASGYSKVSGSTRVWTLPYAFVNAGNRTVTFKASADGNTMSAGKSVSVQILALPAVISASSSHDTITARNALTFTVKTPANGYLLSLFAEGGGIVKTWNTSYSTLSGNVRTWKVPYTFVGAGNRVVTLKASADGKNYGAGKQVKVNVLALPNVTSAVSSHSSITAQNSLTFTVKTPTNGYLLSLYAEGGTIVKTWNSSYSTVSGNVRTWKVPYTFVGAGNRVVTLKASADGKNYGAGQQVKVNVLAVPNVTSAVSSHSSITAQNSLTFTVKTPANGYLLSLYAEGGTIVKTWNTFYSTVSGNVRTWKVPYTFVGAGNRVVTLKTSADGKNYGAGKQVKVNVFALPAVTSAAFSPSTVSRGETTTIVAYAPSNGYMLHMFLEDGKLYRTWNASQYATKSGSGYIYRIPYTFTGAGNRVLTFCASADGKHYGAGRKVNVTVK